MRIDVEKATLEEVAPLRDLRRHALHCQIVRWSLLARGFADAWRITVDGQTAGYGTVTGYGDDPKDIVQEFHVLPEWRGAASTLFWRFAAVAGARTVEAQTNDPLLAFLLFEHVRTITREAILFHDAFPSALPPPPGAAFKRLTEAEKASAFPHRDEPLGDFGVRIDDRVVGTGGFLTHYNPPYADLFMEVDAPYRRRGIGAYLIQELKREAAVAGKVPGARCNPDNHASRATLQKAGMLPCGWILSGILEMGQ